MAAIFSYQQTRFRFLHPKSSYPPTQQPHKICLKQRIPRKGQLVSKMGCAESASLSELDKKLEEELIGMERLSENCKEIGGIVELLECLEMEAIMGEDKGIEASDYHRRADIFDKSSRVFLALKERSSSCD
ncbi:Voltage-dependent T-type calcium channel subunit alpha-1I [Dorcoceras hygrometricum]|uniref:Voltage-dependent T-type calcium channel subunit alpha-1I n=1 Tax=Dorcoceras hygrometricum TaxID=472368 RepID=A0A2Z7C6P4_9LAMI|nr:Voltage-dependent T-type calcium channel subunit alpha-1I [Dorcoceras hygrometricum]